MLTLDQVVTFGIAAGILIAIPGPSVVFVVGRALSYGRGVALASVVGNTLGLLTIVVLVSAGLGVLVQESVVVFTVLKLVGAAYLVFLGVQAIRHRTGFRRASEVGPMPSMTAMRQGYVVGVSNPKGFMIIGALLPQFVVPDAGRVPLQLLLLGLVAVAIGLVSDSTWAVVAARVRDWFTATPGRGEAIGVIGGTSMIGLGVTLAVSGRD
ncbi:LysE family translocator [Nocardioides sp.]|uniref:LysE family translocator n=1 Tax=Nocardioides sp. TaxID=35761 RepID=UPI002720A93E|nr:LysE family translocator [Nocardioides sp.]MDO9457885.1 LysE family translocator [Nocardioides sp.]